jgi:hypothetical protein
VGQAIGVAEDLGRSPMALAPRRAVSAWYHAEHVLPHKSCDAHVLCRHAVCVVTLSAFETFGNDVDAVVEFLLIPYELMSGGMFAGVNSNAGAEATCPIEKIGLNGPSLKLDFPLSFKRANRCSVHHCEM